MKARPAEIGIEARLSGRVSVRIILLLAVTSVLCVPAISQDVSRRPAISDSTETTTGEVVPYVTGLTDSRGNSIDVLSPISDSITTQAETVPADAVALDSLLDTDSTSPLLQALSATDWTDVGHTGGWSLASVLQLAVSANPNWGTYAANHAEAHAELIKACAFPNPEVELEFGRSTAQISEDGKRPSRSTYAIAFSQPIELPGKRTARRVEAEAGFAVVSGEILEFNSMLRGDVVEAYYTVQYYRAVERLQAKLLEVASQLQELARVRVELGDAGRIEEVNTNVEKLKADRDAKVATRRRMGAQASLNALVGGRLGRDFKLSEPLMRNPTRISLDDSVHAAVSVHPRLVRLAAQLEQRYASLDRQRTEWWPDIKLGVNHSKEFDTVGNAITAGIEIPLWNRNDGGVAKAEAQAQKTYNDIMVALTELRRDVETGYYAYEAARDQIASYEDGLKEGAQEATNLAFLQYQAGAATYSDVLIARRTLQETQQGYLQALFDAATARAKLERARGDVIRCSEVRAGVTRATGGAKQPRKKQY